MSINIIYSSCITHTDSSSFCLHSKEEHENNGFLVMCSLVECNLKNQYGVCGSVEKHPPTTSQLWHVVAKSGTKLGPVDLNSDVPPGCGI